MPNTFSNDFQAVFNVVTHFALRSISVSAFDRLKDALMQFGCDDFRAVAFTQRF